LTNSSHKKKYEKAATLLKKIFITSSDRGWNSIDCALMAMYAKCLRSIGDVQGHINILLKLLQRRTEIGSVDGPEYVAELEDDLIHSKICIQFINLY
jgi:hypothetical protein